MSINPCHVLVVDDEEAVCWSLERAFAREGHRVSIAASAEEAFSCAARVPPDVIMLDVRLPGLDGLTAMARLRQIAAAAPVVVMTAFGNLATAVRAVEEGAFDYLTKPFDLQQALDAVNRALRRKASPEKESDKTQIIEPDAIIGHSAVMQAVFKRIALVVSRDSCVLITGESGTGKELVARAIHRYSSRCNGPFLPVHIAAMNPNLVESELFGHLKGAFTGASESRQGLLQLADGGTVFLDEVAEIPSSIQVKLLRVLESGEVFPVGTNQPVHLNVRIVAATHQNLLQRVEDGRFRHDLYFRLNVFQIHLPPLRERLEDIPLLAEHFVRRFEPEASPLPRETISYLQSLSWLGNVRELRNALEHAAILARGGALLPEHFPGSNTANPSDQLAIAVRQWLLEKLKASNFAPPANLYSELIRCVESSLLEEVIQRVQGNRWEAARWLGLNRATVRKKLAEHDLTDRCGTAPESRNDMPNVATS